MFPLAKEKILKEQLLLGLKLLATPNTRGKPLGWMAAEDWRKMIDLMVEYKIIEKKVPVADLYTNEFVPR
jgi:NitT/TauT family transport system substrate-binding protein